MTLLLFANKCCNLWSLERLLNYLNKLSFSFKHFKGRNYGKAFLEKKNNIKENEKFKAKINKLITCQSILIYCY